MTRRIIEHGDLSLASFANANTLNAQGVTLRTDAGSTFATATASFPSYSTSGSDPTVPPVRTPAIHYNTTADSAWVWNTTTSVWEKSGRNYAYNSAGRSGTNVVLTAVNAGRAFFRSPPLNSPLTLELPLYSTCLDGDIFDISNVGLANLTVNVSAGSTDTITVNSVTGATNYVLTPGQTARFVRLNTGTAWHLMFLVSNTGLGGGSTSIGGATGRRQLPDHSGTGVTGVFNQALFYNSTPLVITNPFTDRAVSLLYTAQASVNINHLGPAQSHGVGRQLLVDGNIFIPLQNGYNVTTELTSPADIVLPLLEYAGTIPAGGSVTMSHEVYLSNFTGAPAPYACIVENITETWVMV
jgi:hypothetical protein